MDGKVHGMSDIHEMSQVLEDSPLFSDPEWKQITDENK